MAVAAAALSKSKVSPSDDPATDVVGGGKEPQLLLELDKSLANYRPEKALVQQVFRYQAAIVRADRAGLDLRALQGICENLCESGGIDRKLLPRPDGDSTLQLLRAMDAKKDGIIDETEFVDWIVAGTNLSYEERLAQCSEGANYANRDNFLCAFQSYAKKRQDQCAKLYAFVDNRCSELMGSIQGAAEKGSLSEGDIISIMTQVLQSMPVDELAKKMRDSLSGWKDGQLAVQAFAAWVKTAWEQLVDAAAITEDMRAHIGIIFLLKLLEEAPGYSADFFAPQESTAAKQNLVQEAETVSPDVTAEASVPVQNSNPAGGPKLKTVPKEVLQRVREMVQSIDENGDEVVDKDEVAQFIRAVHKTNGDASLISSSDNDAGIILDALCKPGEDIVDLSDFKSWCMKGIQTSEAEWDELSRSSNAARSMRCLYTVCTAQV